MKEEWEKEPRKRGRKWLKFCFCILAAVLSGMLFGGAASGIYTHYIEKENAAAEKAWKEYVNTVSNSGEHEVFEGTFTVADVAREAMPAIVAITNSSRQELEMMNGFSQYYQSVSAGSGIILGYGNGELLIATNNHVVEYADTLTVAFIDKSTASAQIKGTDDDNDLAIIAVKLTDLTEDTRAEIRVATVGQSSDTLVGQQVVAIGNALGYGQSVTSGYISAVNREVQVDTSTTMTLMQTDTAINPGNSGGALLNMKGEVIGINVMKYSSNAVEGMGYAIPIDAAMPVLEQLQTYKTRRKVSTGSSGYLGIYCQNVTSQAAEMYDMPMGVYVTEVTKGSAADCAGLQQGDIITALDERKVEDYTDLTDALAYYAAGEGATLTIMRKDDSVYKEQKITVILGRKKED